MAALPFPVFPFSEALVPGFGDKGYDKGYDKGGKGKGGKKGLDFPCEKDGNNSVGVPKREMWGKSGIPALALYFPFKQPLNKKDRSP